MTPFSSSSILFNDGIGVEPTAASLDRADEAAEIFQGMECCLIGVSQTAQRAEAFEWHAARILDRHLECPRSVHFRIQHRRLHAERRKQNAVEAAEVAVDQFLLLDRLDSVHSRGLALPTGAGRLLAANLDQRTERIVADRTEMSGGP